MVKSWKTNHFNSSYLTNALKVPNMSHSCKNTYNLPEWFRLSYVKRNQFYLKVCFLLLRNANRKWSTLKKARNALNCLAYLIFWNSETCPAYRLRKSFKMFQYLQIKWLLSLKKVHFIQIAFVPKRASTLWDVYKSSEVSQWQLKVMFVVPWQAYASK